MALQSYRELVAWQRAFALVEQVYAATAHFPPEERFGLIAQTRRCAVSVPSNIAEGYQRGTRKDYIRFVTIAQGSLAELETQLLIAKSLKYVSESDINQVLSASEEV